ncbi:MAG TPA: aquaporin family protein, partial [Oryzihumus sp.]|nr:aquaporin family protein [Oryzihumus sp.]
VGAVAGAVLANAMYGLDAVQLSGHGRASWPAGLSEVVATGGLVLLIFALARTGRGALAAPAVGAYIGSAYWFTSSTSFANPAVTVGRMFSDTFAGIAPASVPGFVIAQVVGGAAGLALVRLLHPDVATVADDIVLPHGASHPSPAGGSTHDAARAL